MLRVLAVCTHNQTRSVMMAALLQQHADAVGLYARVLSAGLHGGGKPATDRTVRMLAARGLDVSTHRSTRLEARYVGYADLVVCAEHGHVVSICGVHAGAFAKTFTLPEIVELGESVGPRRRAPISRWLGQVGDKRVDPVDYLDQPGPAVGEIDDPTGSAPAAWNATFDDLDQLTRRLASVLS